MNTIKCPKCGAELEITKALKHQIEEQIIASLETKHQADIAAVKKQAGEEAGKKAFGEFESRLANLKKEKDEERYIMGKDNWTPGRCLRLTPKLRS